MGMAASQARYLGLTARKTNVEYEGQQINQQRTALSNQSANLFNQLLTLNPPTPPSTQDYTKIQYSFNNGMYDENVTNYSPLPTTDPDYGTYNYLVTLEKTLSTYTGIENKNADPKAVGVQTVSYTATPGGASAYANYIAGTNGTTNDTWTKVGNYTLNAVDKTNSTQLNEMAQVAKDNPSSNFATAYNAAVTSGDYSAIQYYTFGTGTAATKRYVCDADLKASVDTNVGADKATKPTCWTTKSTTGNGGVESGYIIDRAAGTATSASSGTVYNINATTGELTPSGGGATYDTLTSVRSNKESDTSSTGVTQATLNNYYSTYIDKTSSSTEKAFIDTDNSTGRFSSITTETSPDTTFNLKTNTVTDENAYNDAMNQYNYDNEKYEKQIADINAKTEVIQQQDRTLELRLKQLDTEQEALQTEMESVKKVIDKNIENTFKTFQ